MKVLVVYGTKSGCTEGIAEKIGETLEARGLSAEVVPAEKAGAAQGYDAVVVGSGVRAGQWHQPVRDWVSGNAEALKGLPVAFFTCGLTITDESKRDEVRAYTAPLVESTGVTPVDTGLFAGWFEEKAFGLVERSIMKMMKAPKGDFRDFDAIAEWTARVAEKFEAA